MKRQLAALCFIAISSQATAADWIQIADTSNNNSQYFLDLDSIKPYNKRIPLQTGSNHKHVSGFIKSMYINNHEFRKKGWYYSKEFYIVDCNNETYYRQSYIIYGFKGEAINSYQNNYFTINDFEIAFPETLGEVIVNTICFGYDTIYNGVYN